MVWPKKQQQNKQEAPPVGAPVQPKQQQEVQQPQVQIVRTEDIMINLLSEILEGIKNLNNLVAEQNNVSIDYTK